MDSAVIGAAAAILGSLVGGLSSLLTSWLTQSQKLHAERDERMFAAREALFGEFIREAAKLLAEAAEHEDGSVSALAPILAVLARMRLVSSAEVITEGQKFVHLVLTLYREPNLTMRQLIDYPVERLDPLRNFSEACRRELDALRP